MVDELVSALIVLQPAAADLGGTEEITTATLDAYLPDPDADHTIRAYFDSAGFRVEPRVGLSEAIVGPRSLFERTFGAAIGSDLELPLDRLPSDVQRGIRTVTFTPPPDFGPTGGFSA